MTRINLESPEKEHLAELLKASIQSQLKALAIGIEKTKKKIQGFETQFQMPSVQFHQEYLKGNMGDAEAVMEWAGEIETLRKLERDYVLLIEAEVC
ncbi:MAG: hypothetical protein HYR55_02680 [Acidobacteria bacterium]|nr:hypothetical protein [Acidobacteriota bacterium]MBI3656080.1 hypothetical protein [Acidobacteriota bacterium]